ncbi:hypothetical protein DFH06DRAFT_1440197 [Mycena polygramma]|nr:hypothetical protein DFH06DRAFT_1440197 [Mycena polygramma]
MEAAVPHRARVQFLKTSLDADDYHLFDGPMPLLRRLELFISEEEPLKDSPTLHEVPLLRIVVLNDVAASQITLPWTQLTSLTLIRVFPSDRRDIMLPCLESLTLLAFNDTRPVTNFLPDFIVPALRSLEIPERFLRPDPIGSLTAFVSKSNCKLEELQVTGERLLGTKSYRRAFPALRKLSFDTEMADEEEEDSEDLATSDN